MQNLAKYLATYIVSFEFHIQDLAYTLIVVMLEEDGEDKMVRESKMILKLKYYNKKKTIFNQIIPNCTDNISERVREKRTLLNNILRRKTN